MHTFSGTIVTKERTTIMMVLFELCHPALPFGTIIDDLAAIEDGVNKSL